MYQTLLNDSKLYESLRELDEEIAAEWKEGDCGFCGEILHWARYRRKPRGGPMESKTPYQFRLSFCCALCRRRTTPPSVVFLGRKVFFGAVVVLACALRHGAEGMVVSKLQELTGASQRTLRRWLKWWREDFVRSRFWASARGRLKHPVEEGRLPRSLLDCFEAKEEGSRLRDLLRFLSPLSQAGCGSAEDAR